MKKRIGMFLALVLTVSLCACSDKQSKPKEEKEHKEMSTVTEQGVKEKPQNVELSLLTEELYLQCSTEDGFYYIPGERKQLKDGSYGSVIMYMDFETKKEVYLCSNTGCNHDTTACTAIISEDDFSLEFGKMFVHGGKLYLLNRGTDSEGMESFGISESEITSRQTGASTLYRMNLDGTGREKIYTFADGVTAEEIVMGDEGGLYFAVKELKESTKNNETVTTASNRKIIRYDLTDGTVSDAASLDIANGAYWRIIGCAGDKVVLSGIQYGEGVEENSDYTAEQWSEISRNVKSKYVLLSVSDGTYKELYTAKNKAGYSGEVLNGSLYVSEGTSEDIIRIDLESLKKTVLTSVKQNNICDTVGDKLVCRTWDMTEDYALYFVDTATGKVSKSGLVNKYNGWALEIMGETKKDALVIYDFVGEQLPDGAYEIEQYRYALIEKEDFYKGIDTFRPIDMIGKGR